MIFNFGINMQIYQRLKLIEYYYASNLFKYRISMVTRIVLNRRLNYQTSE